MKGFPRALDLPAKTGTQVGTVIYVPKLGKHGEVENHAMIVWAVEPIGGGKVRAFLRLQKKAP